MPRLTPLHAAVAAQHPDLPDVDAAIAAGHVTVNGAIVTNPASGVRAGSTVAVRAPEPLRGLVKLRAALARWPMALAGAAALDAGAAAGGFTRALLEAGVRRVYAVDAGHGQLLGALRQDPRVVNLEGTNISQLDTALIPEPIDAITLDLSYLSLAAAASQLEALDLSPRAELVALVKPMFELRRSTAPTDRESLDEALARACAGIERAGWQVVDSMDSPVTGARGAPELFIYARRPT